MRHHCPSPTVMPLSFITHPVKGDDFWPARDAHGRDQGRFAGVLTCFLQSKEVFAQAGKLFVKAKKFVTTVKKFTAKFDVFRLKRSLLQPGFDVNQSLQVEPDGRHNRSASGFNLHARL